SFQNETRSLIRLNSFGFYGNGTLDVYLRGLSLKDEKSIDGRTVGFSLSKSRVDGMLTYAAEDLDECVLNQKSSSEPLILFLIDVKTQQVKVQMFGEQDSILTVDLQNKEAEKSSGNRRKRESPQDAAKAPTKSSPVAAEVSKGKEPEKKKAEPEKGTRKTSPEKSPSTLPSKVSRVQRRSRLPLCHGKSSLLTSMHQVEKTFALGKRDNVYNFSFHLTFGSKSEGLYSLNFHNCRNRNPGKEIPFNLDVLITERNPGGYLSAAEIPLPLLYIVMSGFFFTAAMFWVHSRACLCPRRFNVFKIHWLMAALAFTKSLSLIFHSINFYFINTKGHPIEGWAVMYYITHLLKGALLFITLALIGTGWAFVKYILSDKEKKIFMIVIPLQVLANVAYIIIESTEEGASEYALWKEILFLVDLICCGAILFPVVWSIRHLQEASSTDGKAAMNLEKLKLFRHYYVMIVCYIYFTRIIAILLKVTVPFQWQWFYELLVEVSTLIFFVLTGYKFRPASNNPYLQLPQDEEDVEMDEVVTESGVLEGISKVKKTSNGRERLRDSAV
ncbi:GP108 protein, partial [Atractosteus spatula]|nr:GP108 protein [Atractosteus spatula]